MDDNISRINEYEFPQGYRVTWLEEILKEFQIETKESWSKLSDFQDDWLFEPTRIFKEPDNPEFYSILYTCIPEVNNPNHDFAETLIESLLSYTGYLEGCLQKDKKEDK